MKYSEQMRALRARRDALKLVYTDKLAAELREINNNIARLRASRGLKSRTL
jgi:hypothetical protein